MSQGVKLSDLFSPNETIDGGELQMQRHKRFLNVSHVSHVSLMTSELSQAVTEANSL
jgi:hypothetical protein